MELTSLLRRGWYFFSRHLDIYLLVAVAGLVSLGLITLYSASNQSLERIYAQGINLSVAFTVMWIAANIKPQQLMRLALPTYVVGVALLVGVALFGEISKGAQRWLHVGVTRIQPSELMRIAAPLMLAWYFHRHEAELRLRDYAVAAVLLGIPVALILKQPDLGTAVMIAASGCYVLFLAGLSWRIILGLGAGFLALLPLVWSRMHEYQKQRVLTLIDPESDPLGKGYHTIQSTIAVGSGGITGKGYLGGTQTHLDFIPERTTDFIFAVYSEEFGLLGNAVLLLAFLLIISRGLVISAQASTFFSRLLAGAITMTFFTYAFVNMGMVSGILPVVGVPLPLVSYGGTSLVTLFLGFGILMSVQTNRTLVKK